MRKVWFENGIFPFFIDIENKKGLIVGGGRIAAHKAEKVKPFGAKITIIAPDIMDKLNRIRHLCVRSVPLCRRISRAVHLSLQQPMIGN